MPFETTRRRYLLGSLGLTAWPDLAAAWQHAREAANSPAPRLQTLDPGAAKEIEAIVCQIIPSGDSPGAREAGVIYFIDRALGSFEADKKDTYRNGLEQSQQVRRKLFPDSTSIAALASQQQVDLIRAIEKSDFFELLRTHTVLGFLGPPSYGGNRAQVGWKHIGFEDRMAFEPPFGHYDREQRRD